MKHWNRKVPISAGVFHKAILYLQICVFISRMKLVLEDSYKQISRRELLRHYCYHCMFSFFCIVIYKNCHTQICPRICQSLCSKRTIYNPIQWAMKNTLCQSEDPELFSIQRNIPWPLSSVKINLIKTQEHKLICNTNIVLFEPVYSSDWITLSERKTLQPLYVSESSLHLKLSSF